MEFEEIRPYHDEELPQIFEELIADPAFQQVACAVMPGVPFEAIAQKCAQARPSRSFRRTSAMESCISWPRIPQTD